MSNQKINFVEKPLLLIDIAGSTLTAEDEQLLQHPLCAGIVLFSRNYQNLPQLCALTAAIRGIKPHALIAVDQEGGRVQRFKQGFTLLPPMSYWGILYEQDRQACYRRLSHTIFTMCTELHQAGINLNFMPVLDIDHGVSSVIGDRSLHSNPEVVAELGELIITELHRQGFPAVGKHFPGHGAVALDSHQTLPVDDRDWTTLWQQELHPFTRLIHQLDAVMPAHVVFSALDHRPASFSPFWLKEVLRQQLNFKGVIISDDLSMNGAATRGDYAQRATEAVQAGCDLLTVCNNRLGAIAALTALSSNSGHVL